MATFLSEAKVNRGMGGDFNAEKLIDLFVVVVVFILKAFHDFAEIVVEEEVLVLLGAFEVVME